MLPMQATRCRLPAAQRLGGAPVPLAPVPPLRWRCSGRGARLVVSAGPKKKLKKEMKELNEVGQRKGLPASCFMPCMLSGNRLHHS